MERYSKDRSAGKKGRKAKASSKQAPNESQDQPTSMGLTVEGLIEQLQRCRDKGVPVVIHNQAGLPFTYVITGVISASNFDVAHLFDKSQPVPENDCVYLLVTIEPGAS